MKMFGILTLFLFFSNSVYSQVETGPVLIETPPVSGYDVVTGSDRLLRPWNVTFELSTASLMVPLKPGLRFGYSFDPEWTVEFSAMSGSLSAGWLSAELARLTETSYSVVFRSYGQRRSFNYLIGFSQENARVNIGNRYVDMATGAGSIDIAQVQSWALVAGLGQTWSFRNGLVLGVDYARIALPLMVANKDSQFFNSTATNDKKSFIGSTMDALARFPRLSILQVHAGWSF